MATACISDVHFLAALMLHQAQVPKGFTGTFQGEPRQESRGPGRWKTATQLPGAVLFLVSWNRIEPFLPITNAEKCDGGQKIRPILGSTTTSCVFWSTVCCFLALTTRWLWGRAVSRDWQKHQECPVSTVPVRLRYTPRQKNGQGGGEHRQLRGTPRRLFVTRWKHVWPCYWSNKCNLKKWWDVFF